jgi:hypothetical protein
MMTISSHVRQASAPCPILPPHAGRFDGGSGPVRGAGGRGGPNEIDAVSLELDLIDHGLDETGEGAGEKDEPHPESETPHAPLSLFHATPADCTHL